MKILAITTLLLFAGCLGIGPDQAGFRDVVTVTYTAVDANTGDVLSENQQLTFILVPGQSGLGIEFEDAIIGMRVNDTKTVTSKGSGYDQDASALRIYDAIPAVREIDTATLNGFLGFDAVVGTQFDLQFYPAIVEAIENGTATYRLTPVEGQRDPLPDLGVFLVTTVDGDEFIQTLEPDVGATFVIQPPSPFDPRTPLDLAVGSYKVVGAKGDQLLLKYNPTLNPELLDRPLRYSLSLDNVEKTSDAVEPTDGNYGTRYSPQLLSDVDPAILTGIGAMDPATDDHGDHTH